MILDCLGFQIISTVKHKIHHKNSSFYVSFFAIIVMIVLRISFISYLYTSDTTLTYMELQQLFFRFKLNSCKICGVLFIKFAENHFNPREFCFNDWLAHRFCETTCYVSEHVPQTPLVLSQFVDVTTS
jgi:hypothetical protein